MIQSFNCSNIGMKCEWSARADNLRSLMNRIAMHLEQQHDEVLSFDLKQKIERSIKHT